MNLMADSVEWSAGTRQWSFSIGIENLTQQPFGTPNGFDTATDGTRIFIFGGPSGG